MRRDEIDRAWETYPEYVTAQQYSRCLDRILASLPQRMRKRASASMTRAAVWVQEGIAIANAEPAPGESMPRAERIAFRDAALAGIEFSREGLTILKEEHLGSRSDISAAFELLERIESGVRSREIPVD